MSVQVGKDIVFVIQSSEVSTIECINVNRDAIGTCVSVISQVSAVY